MIARIVIYLILIIVLSDLYIDMHYFRKRYPPRLVATPAVVVALYQYGYLYLCDGIHS